MYYFTKNAKVIHLYYVTILYWSCPSLALEKQLILADNTMNILNFGPKTVNA